MAWYVAVVQGRVTCSLMPLGLTHAVCSWGVPVQWLENLYDGYGKLTFPDGSSYEGDFKCGARHGR